MAEEKLFTIPLRRSVNKKPHYKRSKKAIITIKEYIQRHMKVNEVKIGSFLNKKIWERGNRHPPGKIKVKSKIEDNKALVELPEFEFQKKKEVKKEGLKEKLLGKKEEAPKEEELKKIDKLSEFEDKKQKEIKKEEKLVQEGKVEEKHTKEEQKLQEKHPKEHKGLLKEEVSKGKFKYKDTMPAKEKASRFLKHQKAPKKE